MRQTVYAMCGISFSGKSTAARALAAKLNIALVSLDAINHERGLQGGEGMTDTRWEETSHIAMDKVAALLKQVRSVVVDDTFSHRFLRDRCRRVAYQHGCRFLILHTATPLNVIQVRRSVNDANPTRHHIKADVFTHHVSRFQFPTDDEPVVQFASEGDFTRWLDQQS